ncbi:quinone oxidoreductase family protein [Deinococcus cellulosilyticus]|uniref:Alcohol dehydrogenase n=1 Tax=Deinococcus cellulosilyticus (strain DSM 18568 / NBRC 106333 / KACC 11606 / 5516J-15) TaxID=1223518 RepID=A0A511N9A0_DEIC1|nr:quinone oxidoreductase [Deinococcus cellulosilyticus]GEM49419.1 alcohol dehydrogenase [Deinococcus cellulosilyticus NBRC 106333 = KACC 11606]
MRDMMAMVARTLGPADVLRPERMPIPEPAPTEVRIKVEAVGVNYVDVQHRAGFPYSVQAPLVPGIEAVGTIEKVGNAVTGWQIGDRVGVAGPMCGWYAEQACAPAERLIPIPQRLSSTLAAAVMLQGMTAHMLTETVTHLMPGQAVLVHAAAGGVGLHLVQLAKRRGAMVFGTVSSQSKALLARDYGCDHVLVGTQDWDVAVRKHCPDGVDVVFDGVGGSAFQVGLRALRAGGHMVCYGQSAGPVPPIDPAQLSGFTGQGNQGSLTLTWSTLSDHNRHPQDMRARAAAVFELLQQGDLRVHLAAEFPLIEAAEAHRRLESRNTTGKLVLQVSSDLKSS